MIPPEDEIIVADEPGPEPDRSGWIPPLDELARSEAEKARRCWEATQTQAAEQEERALLDAAALAVLPGLAVVPFTPED